MKPIFFKPLFLSLFLVLCLFGLGTVFPYQHECDAQHSNDTTQTEQASADYQPEFYGQDLSNTAHDSCMMNPRNFEMPDDDYQGSYKDFFAERPITVQPCKNCHTINNTTESPDNDRTQLEYKNRVKQQTEQAAFERMMEAYKRQEDEDKNYTEVIKKMFADGSYSRKP